MRRDDVLELIRRQRDPDPDLEVIRAHLRKVSLDQSDRAEVYAHAYAMALDELAEVLESLPGEWRKPRAKRNAPETMYSFELTRETGRAFSIECKLLGRSRAEQTRRLIEFWLRELKRAAKRKGG